MATQNFPCGTCQPYNRWPHWEQSAGRRLRTGFAGAYIVKHHRKGVRKTREPHQKPWRTLIPEIATVNFECRALLRHSHSSSFMINQLRQTYFSLASDPDAHSFLFSILHCEAFINVPVNDSETGFWSSVLTEHKNLHWIWKFLPCRLRPYSYGTLDVRLCTITWLF